MKLSKCYKRLMGLKETTKPKDNLAKLERVDEWNKCQTRQMQQYKKTSDLDSRTPGYLCLFCWLLGSATLWDGRNGGADRRWGAPDAASGIQDYEAKRSI